MALTLLGRPPHGFTGAQQRPVSLSHQVSSDRLFSNANQRATVSSGSSTLPAALPHQVTASTSHQHLHYVGSPPSTSSTGSASSPSPCGPGSTSSTSSSGGVRRSATTVGSGITGVSSADAGKEFITGPQPVDVSTVMVLQGYGVVIVGFQRGGLLVRSHFLH